MKEKDVKEQHTKSIERIRRNYQSSSPGFFSFFLQERDKIIVNCG